MILLILTMLPFSDDLAEFDCEPDRLWWRLTLQWTFNQVQLIFNLSVHPNHRHVADLQPWEFSCFSFRLFRLLLQRELRSFFSLIFADILHSFPNNPSKSSRKANMHYAGEIPWWDHLPTERQVAPISFFFISKHAGGNHRDSTAQLLNWLQRQRR